MATFGFPFRARRGSRRGVYAKPSSPDHTAHRTSGKSQKRPQASSTAPRLLRALAFTRTLRPGLDNSTGTTRQLLDTLTGYSTATRQDSSTATRQFSTDLDRTPPDCMRRGVKVSSSTAQQLDRPRQCAQRKPRFLSPNRRALAFSDQTGDSLYSPACKVRYEMGACASRSRYRASCCGPR